MKRLTPLHGHVTIKPDELPDKTASGILLVKELGSYSPTGVVIDSGFEPVKPGDRVVYSAYEAVEFDKELVILPSDGIYGVLGNESE